MELEKSEHYDIKALKKYLLMVLAVMACWKVSPLAGAVLVSTLLMGSIAREKPMELIFWVLFLTYTAIGNHYLLGGNTGSLIVVRITLMLLPIVLPQKWKEGGRNSRLLTPFLGVLPYLAWEALVSMQGFNPVISYLKLFLFCCLFFAFFCMANTVNHSAQTDDKLLRSVLLAFISLLLIGSILLLPFPALSQLSGEEAFKALQRGEGVSLFMGLTSHSQDLGLVAAIMGTLLFADLAFSIKKWDKLYILFLLICPFLVYKSSSRTAMGTYVAGMGMVFFLILRDKGVAASWKGKLLMAINMLVVAAGVVVCVMPSVREKIIKFVLKTSGQSTAREIRMERIIYSRQGLIDEMKRNFKDNPLMGNGFQVSSNMIGRTPTGLRSYLSAPVEKGVWIYAVLEEGGVIGMLLICGWLLFLFRLLIMSRAYIGTSVFFAFLISNFGEFTFFSLSSSGGFFWALTFAALCLDFQRLKLAITSNSNVSSNTSCAYSAVKPTGIPSGSVCTIR